MPAESSNHHSERILIVEDEVLQAMSLKTLLEGHGYDNVSIASSGEKAVALFGREAFDMLIMDIDLKGTMDGIEAVKAMRMHRPVHVIYLTAYSDQESIERAKSTMPLGYMMKPVNDRELLIAVDMALYTGRLHQRLHVQDICFRMVAEEVSDAVFFTDEFQRITFCNRAAARIFGYSRNEMEDLTLEVLVSGGIQNGGDSSGSSLPDPGANGLTVRTVVSCGRKKNGTVFPVEISFLEHNEKSMQASCIRIKDLSA